MPSEKVVKTKVFDNKLEGLRGLCAIVVAICHLFSSNFFGASKTPLYSPIMHIQFAHIAVLIFFIISGYVIGASHFNKSFNFKSVKDYLNKRLIRLYPMYFIALVISIVLGYSLVSKQQILGHLFFLQEFFVKTMASNPVLWSLSYEVFYYLIFLCLWAIHKKFNNLYTNIAFVVIVLSAILYSNTAINSLLIGWLFWLIGLYTSTLKTISLDKKTDRIALLSYFLILLATYNLQSGGFFLRLLKLYSDTERQINLTDLVFIPVCTLIVMEITCKKFKHINFLRLPVFAIPAINIIGLLYFNHPIFSRTGWTYGTAFFLLAISMLVFKSSPYGFEKISFSGRISYAIYIYHFPIGFLLSMFLSNYLTGIPLFIIGLFCWIILTIALSYFTEIKLQPFIQKLLVKRQAAAIV